MDNNVIGKKVMKISRRPFKSTFQINTIKGVIIHPITKREAYIFEEDESYVEAFRCEILSE